jgi:type I restriction enzyme R subunit
VDFVGVLREVEKALAFASQDVSGVIEDLDLLLKDLLAKLERHAATSLTRRRVDHRTSGWSASFTVDSSIPRRRRNCFQVYKDIEALWEILSPSAELRDHIQTLKRMAQLTPRLDRVTFDVGR